MGFQIANMSLQARACHVIHDAPVISAVPWWSVLIKSPVPNNYLIAARWQFSGFNTDPMRTTNECTLTIVATDPVDLNDEAQLKRAVGSQLQLKVRFFNMRLEYLTINLSA